MELKKIKEIIKKVDLTEDDVILYGDYKCKLKEEVLKKSDLPNSKLILVSAITPTKAGEGKTFTTISLLDGLNKLNKKAIAVLREPSMGPTFGLKGGATGGGKETIEPSIDINLHFTGDLHALTSSINLISAVIDNSIYQGNPLNIDKDRILWGRALDVNDRELREVEIGLGKETNGIKRKDSFQITVASEMMAILCLSKDKEDFISRINDILIAYSLDNKPIYLKDLEITDAIYTLMKDALLPNLVQTSENNPCLVHGGPFANIAHGCASLIGTTYAKKLAPIVIEEAGFGSDLGAEKFLDIKCHTGKLDPSLTILVVTIKALKLHGGQKYEELDELNLEALNKGMDNLYKHYYNLKSYNIPVIVSINHFDTDKEEEIKELKKNLEKNNIKYAFLDSFNKGSDGAIDLSLKVLEALDTKKDKYHRLYSDNLTFKEKILKIVNNIYGIENVTFTCESLTHLNEIEENIGKDFNLNEYSVCIAKTQSSFSDDPTILNLPPKDHNFIVRDIYISNGAKFIVVLAGNILTMPGLPKIPRAVNFRG